MNKSRKKLIILLVILTILFILIMYPLVLKMIYRLDYWEYIEKYSKQENIDPLLIVAIVKAESNFKKEIKSKSGAIGLMQLMEKTALEEAEELQEDIDVIEKLYEPEINIKIGIKYFAKLMKKYDENIPLALAAYNAGRGNVDSWIEKGMIKEDGSDIENIPFKETNNYVRKILRDYRIYQNLYK